MRCITIKKDKDIHRPNGILLSFVSVSFLEIVISIPIIDAKNKQVIPSIIPSHPPTNTDSKMSPSPRTRSLFFKKLTKTEGTPRYRDVNIDPRIISDIIISLMIYNLMRTNIYRIIIAYKGIR